MAKKGDGEGIHQGNPASLPKGRSKGYRNQYSQEEPEEPTELERLFVQHYVVCWDAQKSAVAAGYSERSAYSTASKICKKPRVKKLIEDHLAQVKVDYRQSHEAITEFLMRVIYSDTTDLLEIKTDEKTGKQTVSFKNSDVITNKHGMLIDSISITRHGIKIDIFSKQQALDMLNKHVGYYEADNKQKVEKGPTFYIPDNGRNDTGDQSEPQPATPGPTPGTDIVFLSESLKADEYEGF